MTDLYKRIDEAHRKAMDEAFEFARLMAGWRSGSVPAKPTEPPPPSAVTYVVRNGSIVPERPV